MRDLKFRTWDTVLKQFVPLANAVAWPSFDELVSKESQRYSIMKFTGLKDKSGVEIYEGDVFGKRKEFRAVVEQEEDGRRIVKFVDKKIPSMSITNRLIKESEVIGTIYENPELLK